MRREPFEADCVRAAADAGVWLVAFGEAGPDDSADALAPRLGDGDGEGEGEGDRCVGREGTGGGGMSVRSFCCCCCRSSFLFELLFGRAGRSCSFSRGMRRELARRAFDQELERARGSMGGELGGERCDLYKATCRRTFLPNSAASSLRAKASPMIVFATRIW